MKKILLDADVLVAIAKIDDVNHDKAVTLIQKIEKEQVCLSLFTVPEVVTVLSYRVSAQAAHDFLLLIRELQYEELEVSFDVAKRTDELFLKHVHKRVSWFDCCNIALCQKHNIDAICSFDKFYKKQGIAVIS